MNNKLHWKCMFPQYKNITTESCESNEQKRVARKRICQATTNIINLYANNCHLCWTETNRNAIYQSRMPQWHFKCFKKNVSNKEKASKTSSIDYMCQSSNVVIKDNYHLYSKEEVERLASLRKVWIRYQKSWFRRSQFNINPEFSSKVNQSKISDNGLVVYCDLGWNFLNTAWRRY